MLDLWYPPYLCPPGCSALCFINLTTRIANPATDDRRFNLLHLPATLRLRPTLRLSVQEPSKFQVIEIEKAPQVGLEPTTHRLTAGCSAIELLRSNGTDGDNFRRRDPQSVAKAETAGQWAFATPANPD